MSRTRHLHSLATGLATVVLAGSLALAPHPVAAVVINFDDLNLAATIVPQPGNQYAVSGITFTSGNVPATLNPAIAVGDVFTLGGVTDGFVAIKNNNAISDPNFAGALNLGLQDTLMSFSAPITSLSLHSDDSPSDGNDVIRLLALEATGNSNEYRVLAFLSASDGAVSEPGNLLAVSVPTGFSFGLFQVTTEQEGFDDVSFNFRALQVPEPPAWLLLAASVLGFRLSSPSRGRVS
jgi:hypothetical protein